MIEASKNIKGVAAFILGIVVSVGISYLYRIVKSSYEMEVPEFVELFIYLAMLLPVGFGMAFFLKAYKK